MKRSNDSDAEEPEGKRHQASKGTGARSLEADRRKIFDLAHRIYTLRLATEFLYPTSTTADAWIAEAWADANFAKGFELDITDNDTKLV